jgi:hypothetical protein
MLLPFVLELRDVVLTPCSSIPMNQFLRTFRRRYCQQRERTNHLTEDKRNNKKCKIQFFVLENISNLKYN